MKYALVCEHCHSCALLPPDEFGRDSVVDWFAQIHAVHLEGEEMIVVTEQICGSTGLYRFAGMVGKPS